MAQTLSDFLGTTNTGFVGSRGPQGFTGSVGFTGSKGEDGVGLGDGKAIAFSIILG